MHETKSKTFSYKLTLNILTLLVIAIATVLSQTWWKSLKEIKENEGVSNILKKEELSEIVAIKREIQLSESKTAKSVENLKCPEIKQPNQAKYWFHRHQNDLQIFETADKVLKRLKLQWISMNASSQQTIHYDWDLLWSYEHFCEIPLDWRRIQFHQKINHIPGSFHLTSKSVFGSTTDSKYVPKAFLNVKDVKSHAKDHPDTRYVVKLKSNRGVTLQNVVDMNFTDSNSQNDYFAMEFIENPLLFNGHKFDFAVYVVITSISPLRLYYYNKNIIMRFCPETYDTSNPEDRDRYVVKSSHIPGSKFPGVETFFENDYTYKEAFNAFLKSKGVDEGKVWKDVEDLIRLIVLSKEKFFIDEAIKLGATRYSFFEMYRFDLFLDQNLNLFVFEINQSPNIYASEKYVNNQNVYENVLYNLFNLIGVATSYKTENLRFKTADEESMVVHSNSLKVKPETCMSFPCNQSYAPQCELCWNFLNQDRRYDLRIAYLEQMRSGEMKRLFPPKKDFMAETDDGFWDSLQRESKHHLKWFIEMCKRDEKFC